MSDWGEKQDQAIQRIHDQLLESVQDCQTMVQVAHKLSEGGWPAGFGKTVTEATRGAIAFYVTNARRKELMDTLKAEHDKATTTPGEQASGMQADKAAQRLGMPKRHQRTGMDSMANIMGTDDDSC